MAWPVVVGTVASIGMSVIGGEASKKQAEKQLALQRQIAVASLAQQEKFDMEKLRVEQETARTGILAGNLLAYRQSLQKESTARLKDTGIYVAGLGVGMGSFYGLYLMFSKD